MSKIYVLQLQKNKFYVGKTNNIECRYQEHLNGIGSI
jgi:predicted GIY-YIG superfamily endonuclease